MSDLNFRIESSAKAYEVLANNLYSDKKAAVIRELSCNAADAHAEAGIPEIPFEVDLPTQNNHFFRVRDFGNGLRPDQIEDVFAVFFSSTKAGSKSYTGAFGLGCKSPFAVSDNFFVNSYVDGIKSYYHCHKKNGVPAIAFIKEENTDKKTGLEIIVPINSGFLDEYGWKERAMNIYEFFKVRPKTNIKINYFNECDEHKCGNGWENTREAGAWVVMSNVRYRLDLSKIKTELVSNEHNFKKRGVVYHVPPRSIEVTPSREGISYTQETIDFLNSYIAKVNNNFFTHIQEEIQKSPSMFIAKMNHIQILKKYYEEYFGSEKFISPCLYTWNDKPLSNGRHISSKIDYTDTIEIGWLYKPAKYAANTKKPLFTNTEIPSNNDLLDKTLIIVLNDTKASQDTVKAWANRKFKSSNMNSITFLVVKSEYKNILTEYNKISEKSIIKCSEQNLQKLSSVTTGRSKAAAKNILLHSYSIKQNMIVAKNSDSEKDLIGDLIDENNNVYFIEYLGMTYDIPCNVTMGSHPNDEFYSLEKYANQYNSLVKDSEKAGNKLEIPVDKILLIKNLKKNKLFMKKYAKENKVRFIPFKTYFQNVLEKHMCDNPSMMEYLATSHIVDLIRLDNCEDIMMNYKNLAKTANLCLKLNQLASHYFCLEKYIDTSPELRQFCEFIIKYDFGKTNKKSDFSIDYVLHFMCDSNRIKLYNLVLHKAKDMDEIADVLFEMINRFGLIFADEEEKNEKIIEYVATGKIT